MEGLSEKEIAVLAKLGLSIEDVKAENIALIRKKKATARKNHRFKVCTIKRLIRSIKCLTCDHTEHRWIMMRELQLFYWEGKRVADNSWTFKEATSILRHAVLSCEWCIQFVDSLTEDEAKKKLKEFYLIQMGKLAEYDEPINSDEEAVKSLIEGG